MKTGYSRVLAALPESIAELARINDATGALEFALPDGSTVVVMEPAVYAAKTGVDVGAFVIDLLGPLGQPLRGSYLRSAVVDVAVVVRAHAFIAERKVEEAAETEWCITPLPEGATLTESDVDEEEGGLASNREKS